MFYKVSGYCFQVSDLHRHYCCLFFPKSFYFDFQVLVLSDLFQSSLINFAIFWYCHINQPHLLLFNHCYIWYVMSQMFVYLNFKFQKILASTFCSTFSTLCFHHFSEAGRRYFLHRFECGIEATLL